MGCLKKWKWIRSIWITCLLCCFATTTLAEQGEDVIRDLNHLLSHARAKVGIVVQSMQTGKILYQKNATELLIPASNIKLFTAYAALDKLGPDFKFQTQMLTNAPSLQSDVLDGNLYVKFTGDPDLESQDLEQMIVTLGELGIHTIKGSVIIDNSIYDNQGIAPGTVYEDTHYCYGAPVNALILNHNCINTRLLPSKPGRFAHLEFPKNIIVPIRNTVVTLNTRHKRCSIYLAENNIQQLQVAGCVRSRSKPIEFSIPVLDTKQYAEIVLKSLLQKHRITVLNNTSERFEHILLKPLVTHYSRTLTELVYDMLKNSDNLIANSIFKQLGFVHFNRSGSWENAGTAMYDILSLRHGINVRSMYMIDGSGLSRYNVVTPVLLSQLLYTAYHNNYLANSFISALPIAGINGTLKTRMRTLDLIGKVRAKTGTMKGVSSLSGYIETREHQTLSFSIIVNNFIGSPDRYRMLEDKICKYLSTI